MLELQFFFENAHFAINLFGALVFFAVAWLYFDAWTGRKRFAELIKVLGFALISVSFVVRATYVEQTILLDPLFGRDFISTTTLVLRIIGYAAILFSIAREPLQERPNYSKLSAVGAASGNIALPAAFSLLSLPLFTASIAFFYLRRATVGLENHLKPVAFGFFLLSLSELFGLATLFRDTTIVGIFKLVAPFGAAWIVEHLLFLMSVIIIGKWVFAYLLKRLQTQLFMILASLTLLIFLLTTVSFTFLLIENLKTDALNHLKTDVNILSSSIQSKQAEILSDGQLVAQNSEIKKAIKEGNRVALRDLTTQILLSKKESTLVVTSATGEILARAEDPEQVGDSLSGDSLFQKIQDKKAVSSVIVTDGVLAPTVSLRAGIPVTEGNDFIGSVIVGTDIDNAFVDGIKRATGLDTSIYGGNIRSATTFVAQDGKSRWVGTAEDTQVVKKQVLGDGKPYTGSVNILGVSYLAAFAPLRDADNVPVGMLFVGRESIEILQTAGRSIELTFIVSAVLLVLSIIPAFIIARYLSRQIK
jgi:hypothetical protein